MPQQGLPAPARQTVRPGARCWDAMGVECFAQYKLDLAMQDDFSSETGRQNTATVKYAG
jgi:uncharacterized protein involved in copper resistance